MDALFAPPPSFHAHSLACQHGRSRQRASLSSVGFTVVLAFLPTIASTADANEATGTGRTPAGQRAVATSDGGRTARRGAVPIVFEENSGQTAADVRFVTRQGDLTSWFGPSEIVFALGNRGRDKVPDAGSRPHARADLTQETASRRSVVRMRLVGANPAPRVVGLDPLPGETHYLIGSDPARWRTHVRQYGRLAYRDVYPGIDLVFYSRAGRLEYDFDVQPGVDEGGIELAFDGMDEAGPR